MLAPGECGVADHHDRSFVDPSASQTGPTLSKCFDTSAKVSPMLSAGSLPFNASKFPAPSGQSDAPGDPA
jgi:hypothetical protein